MRRRIAGVVALVALAAFLMGTHAVGNVIRMGFGEAASAGLIGSITAVNKFGRNQDSDTSEDSIWDGSDLGGPIRCFDVIGTTAAALYLSSDDENDAAKDVTIQYLDANWDAQEVIVTLGAASAGGTLFVQIGSETIMRINRMFATDTALVGNIYAGTDDVDDGTDGIPDTILTELVAAISIGENQTLQACYTVPNGFVALLSEFCTANLNVAANATATFRIRAAVEGTVARTKELLETEEGVFQCTQHNPPIPFEEKTDIELTATMSANNAKASGTFDIILIPASMR